MNASIHSDQLTLRVREIPKAGRRFRLFFEESDLAEILAQASDAYHTTGQGVSAWLEVTRQAHNVFVRGRVEAQVGFSCCRCLVDNPLRIDASIQWTFLPSEVYRAMHEANTEVELTAEDLDVSFYQGDSIELAQILEETILLELRPYPTCETDCRLDVEQSVSSPESTSEAGGDPNGKELDPRWKPLAALRAQLKSRS